MQAAVVLGGGVGLDEHICTEHRHAEVDEVFGTAHLPDSMCAMALAWMVAAPKAVMAGSPTA